MIKYGNWIWEGTSLETKPGPPEAYDGHIFKELDTGESYTRVAGQWEYINLGLAFIKATKSGVTVTDSSGHAHVSFVTPFIDAEYSVQLTCDDFVSKEIPVATKSNVLIEGFDISSYNTVKKTVQADATVSWLATRNYNP